MLVLKHEKCVYCAVSYGTYVLTGTDQGFFYNAENINVWKVKGNAHTIMAGGNKVRDNDLLRYVPLFKGELTMEKIINDIIPKMVNIFELYGRMEKNQHFGNTYYIAQNDKAFQINPDRSVTYIDRSAATHYDDLIHASTLLTSHKDTIKIIREAYEKSMVYYGNLHLPIAYMNTKTQKLMYIKE